MKLNKYVFINIIIPVIIFLISKIMGGSILVSLFLAFSLHILFFLARFGGKLRIVAIILGLLTIGLDFILFVLLLVPTKSYQINVENYYKKKENYAKIFIKDKLRELKYVSLQITNKSNITREIKINEYYRKFLKTKIKEKISLKEGDKIYFRCLKKEKCKYMKTFVAIYLWDDTILRITPGSMINLNKVTKNLSNLSESKTNIGVERGNLRFHVIRLIKDSNSMQIETGKGQTLIIRGTAGLVSKVEDKTYAIDYSHYIEVKNQDKSILLKEGQGVEITDKDINILNIDEILNNIGINKDFLKTLSNLDKLDINNVLKNLNNYIKSFQTDGILGKLEKLKINIFSVGDSDYSKYLDNLKNYEYLIGDAQKFTDGLINNPNLAFLASNLEKTEVKILYLYNELKKNIKNSDIYKTYIINLGIEGKIKDVNKTIKQGIENIDIEKIMRNADENIDDLINNLNF